MTNEQMQLMQLFAGMLGMNNQPQQQQQQPSNVGLPIGVYGRDHNNVFLAESVNNLVSWDETVLAKDGGTHSGLKLYFVETKALAKNDKSYSDRITYMARFEVMCARGTNPINEVVNIFMKDQHSHIPYLDPRKWGVSEVPIVFRNIDDDTKRTFRLIMVTFDGKPISDDVHRKCVNILGRLKGFWVYTDGGIEYDEDGPYSEEETGETKE